MGTEQGPVTLPELLIPALHRQGEEQSSSKREGGGLQEEMEPTANWAVVCVVWRLLLTTRYN